MNYLRRVAPIALALLLLAAPTLASEDEADNPVRVLFLSKSSGFQHSAITRTDQSASQRAVASRTTRASPKTTGRMSPRSTLTPNANCVSDACCMTRRQRADCHVCRQKITR